MITAFEVGSIFRLVDEFSPTLRLMLAEIRKFNTAINQARESLAAFGKAPIGLTTAIAETGGPGDRMG